MKIRPTILIIFSLILFQLFNGLLLEAQVQVVKSNEKVIIRGTPYYIHTVLKGQTSFSIAKAYSVSVETLHRENPDAVYGLNEGQTLKIPVVTEELPKVNKTPRDTDKYLYHTISAGETIYSLSRKYDVATTLIIEANPGLELNDIPLGSEIAIPKREFKSESVSLNIQQSEDFTIYKVQNGESINSISKKFGVSARELRRLNKGLVFPGPGDLIKIPGKHNFNEMGAIVSDSIYADSVAIVTEIDSSLLLLKSVGITEISNLRGKIDIAVMLPLFLDENSVRTDIDTTLAQSRKVRTRPFSWVYPPSVSFIEMYEGILLAVEDLRNAGLDVNITTYDTKADLRTVKNIIASGDLRSMDMIIGPVYSYNLEEVIFYANDHNIPVISPVPLQNTSVLIDNPSLFVVNPSIYTTQEKLANEIGEHFESNIVFIYSDTSIVEEENSRFRDLILTELSYRTTPENINFKQISFRSWSSLPNDTINRLDHAMSPLKENVVVLAMDNESALHETIMNLYKMMKNYRMTIVGYPVIRDLEPNIDLNYFCDLGIGLYSPFRVDYKNEDVLRFLQKYRTTFKTEPSEASFAWSGYDITTFFASGLALNGRRFLSHPEMHNPDLLSSRFDFRRSSTSNGFENKGLFRLEYTKEMELIIVENAYSNEIRH